MNEYVRLMIDTRKENEFKMPPVGITETRVQLNGKVFVSYTVRCDVPNCWLVVTQQSRPAADKFLEDHKNGVKFPSGERGWPACPSLPLRESLPSGYKYIDKLWHELDDAMDALYDGTENRVKGDFETNDEMKAYLMGLAFSIVMLDPHLWPNKTAVAKEATRRRKMRLGELEYAVTPSRHRGDLTIYESGQYGVSDEPGVPVAPVAASRPPIKAATKRAVEPEISATTQAAIKAGYKSGSFSINELASAFKVPVETVRKIVG